MKRQRLTKQRDNPQEQVGGDGGGLSVTHTGTLPSTTCFGTLAHTYPVTHLPNGSGYFRAKPFSRMIPQYFSNVVHSTHTYLFMKMEQCSETSGNYPEENIQ